jgi:hypothetical protein
MAYDSRSDGDLSDWGYRNIDRMERRKELVPLLLKPSYEEALVLHAYDYMDECLGDGDQYSCDIPDLPCTIELIRNEDASLSMMVRARQGEALWPALPGEIAGAVYTVGPEHARPLSVICEAYDYESAYVLYEMMLARALAPEDVDARIAVKLFGDALAVLRGAFTFEIE